MSTLLPVLRGSEGAPPSGGRTGGSAIWDRIGPYRVPIALTLIVIGGAAVRLIGLGWGLPMRLHPDEPVIVDGAIDMIRRHSFEPNYYFRPDHVEMELSDVAYYLYSLFHGKSPLALFAQDQSPFYLLSRLITAVFGIGTIVLAYLIGRRFDRVVGLLAALLFAFFPPLVLHAHYATPDVPLTFAYLVVILGCMRYLQTPTLPNLALAAFGVAVAFAIKYPGALGTTMIAAVIIVRGVQDKAWRRIVGHGSTALGAVTGFVFVISPVLFTNARQVWQSAVGESRPDHLGADSFGYFGNLGFYAAGFASAAGLALVVVFLLGGYFTVKLRLAPSIPLYLGAVFWIFLSAVPLHWERWALPMYVTPLLLAAIGIRHGVRFLREERSRMWLRWGRWAVGTIALVAVTNLVVATAAEDAVFRSSDTQSAGRPDLAARGITAANSLSEGYTPLRPGRTGTIFSHFTEVNGRLVLRPKENNRAALKYVLISSAMYERFQAGSRYVAEQRFYRLLAEQFPLVATYVPADPPAATVFAVAGIWRSVGYWDELAHGGLSGPTIRVYAIPPGV